MTRDEWVALYENFETHWLLEAVDAVDSLRGHFNDDEDYRPPELRTNLLKLHSLAMEVVNGGVHSSRVRECFDLASDLEDEVFDALQSLERVQEILSRLIDLYPESLDDDDLIDAETEMS